MKNKIICISLILLIAIFLPTIFVSAENAEKTEKESKTTVSAENTTVASLQALIEQLQQQIKELQDQLAKLKTEVEEVKEELKLTKNLRKGLSDEEVKELQKFLSQFREIYPEGLITGYFGPLTEKAIKKFQEKHDIPATGLVGPLTRGKINEFLEEEAKEEKVTICHIPLGNPAAAHTLIIAQSALEAHLGHGDSTGSCPVTPVTTPPQTPTPTPTPTPPPSVMPTSVLSVSLSASPAHWTAPLLGVDLSVQVVFSAATAGTINFTFYCNRSDTSTDITTPYQARYENIPFVTRTTKTVVDICNYTEPGIYTAKVIVEKGDLRAEARQTITVDPSPTIVQGAATITSIDDQSGPPLGGTSIVIGSDGLPVISYYISYGAVKVAKCGNASCTKNNTVTTIEKNNASTIPMNTSVAIPKDGLPIVSYHDSLNNDLKIVKCGNAACSANNKIVVVDNTPGLIGMISFIFIGSDDLPSIIYSDHTAHTLKAVKCGNSSCSTNNVFTLIGSYSTCFSAALGIDGLPVIYSGGSCWPGLRSGYPSYIIKCGNLSCSENNIITELRSTNIGPSGFSSVAIGKDSFPVISFGDLTFSPDADLKILKCSKSDCSATTTNVVTIVDSVNSYDEYNSIAIGSDGFPIVSYYDTTLGILKVLKCGNSSCSANNTISTVDRQEGEVVGQYSSITIGVDNLPVISYSTNFRGLRVAKCKNTSCSP